MSGRFLATSSCDPTLTMSYVPELLCPLYFSCCLSGSGLDRHFDRDFLTFHFEVFLNFPSSVFKEDSYSEVQSPRSEVEFKRWETNNRCRMHVELLRSSMPGLGVIYFLLSCELWGVFCFKWGSFRVNQCTKVKTQWMDRVLETVSPAG